MQIAALILSCFYFPKTFIGFLASETEALTAYFLFWLKRRVGLIPEVFPRVGVDRKGVVRRRDASAEATLRRVEVQIIRTIHNRM